MEEGRAEFLTVAEVAELLRLNQQTVRNWIDAGTLPAYHVGRRVRIGRTDLDALIGVSTKPSRHGKPAAPSNQPGYSASDFWSGTPHPY